MGGTWPPRKREKERERAMASTDGRVCTIGWVSEQSTQKEELTKARAGEGEKNNRPSSRALGPHQARFDFVAFAC